MREPVIIVLGASGRIGQELLPLLFNSDNVLAGSRATHERSCSGSARWLHLDLTDHDAVATTISRLAAMAAEDTHVIVVDLVLDRTSVATMRRSIAASARYVIALTGRVREYGGTCAVVSASTTAVLAPTFYQTPYGHAKHDQLTSLAHLPGPTLAYLLPQLATNLRDEPKGVTWTYRQAARELAQGIRRLYKERSPKLQLVCPKPDTPQSIPSRSWPQALWRAAPLHLMAWTTRRDRPEAHRAASHTRLGLTPRALRRRVDHHTIPPARVHRLANHLHASLIWVDTQSPVTQESGSDLWVP